LPAGEAVVTQTIKRHSLRFLEAKVIVMEECKAIDFESIGEGPAVVLVPGSCSTGAAWRPVVTHLRDDFRCITTSLPGYGGTAERRTASDMSIDRVAEAVEAVIDQAGAPVHLAGHSFGGLAALAVALRGRVRIASLLVIEPPAVTLLTTSEDHAHADAFRDMVGTYAAAHARGERMAISAMIDFYGGVGTFASMPERVRAYAVQTTPVNLRDWRSAYDLVLTPQKLRSIRSPTTVVCGENSHPAMHRITRRLAERIRGANHVVVGGSAHFVIASHPAEIAKIIENHIANA
jgi:pimeloyl-ACP methyl ester carboxylesterase